MNQKIVIYMIIFSAMDYLVGFIIGFVFKEVYNLLKHLSQSDTFIIDQNWDDEWDWITHEDLP